MAIKRRNKLIGQTTTVNTETQEEVVQPITIIENIVQQNITTNIQNIVEQSVTNVVQNTTIVQMAVEENPAIAGALIKLATIESGAQVNPDISNLATKQEIPDITPLNEAIATKADNQEVSTAFFSVNQTLQNKADTDTVNS